jgi:hypothetical protein
MQLQVLCLESLRERSIEFITIYTDMENYTVLMHVCASLSLVMTSPGAS